MGMLPNGEWIYKSVDGIKTKGYEIEVAGAVTPSWEVSGGYTHNTAEDKEGNPRNTYVPDDVFKFTTSYKLSSLVPNLTVGGSARWQSYTYYDTGIYTATPVIDVKQEQPAYWLLDLMARYPVTDTLSVSANINNVLDKHYNRSMWGYADYGDPRNFSISVRWRM